MLFVTAVSSVAAPLAAQDNPTCLACHESTATLQALTASAPEFDSSLVVTGEHYGASVHGAMGFTCVICHTGVTAPHAAELDSVDCGMCHSSAQEQFDGSLHGYAGTRGNERAPTCASCHGTHDILASTDPESPTNRLRTPDTCATCHGEQPLLDDQFVKFPQSYSAYANSIHGQSNGDGLVAAAKCTDCHGIHDLRSPGDPLSKISPRNVSATCGACHAEEQALYDRSIHGRALQAGVSDSPSCNDCHGEHLILAPEDPAARTHGARMAIETCGRCHNDPVIVAKYRMQGGVVDSYVDSYHGWAARRDYDRAATCVSCHGAHEVLPKADSAATISPANVVATCGTCHPNADAAFAASYTHTAASLATNKVNRVIRSIYIVVIVVTIGGMVIHNLVILAYYAHLELLKLAAKKHDGDTAVVERMDRSQIIQHITLTISFSVLVITGFALRFPDAWWVQQLGIVGMTEPVRSNVHRVAGVVMLGAALLHLHYVLFVDQGRRAIRGLMPQWRDFTDFAGNIRFHTRFTDKKVKFGRFDYTQKTEYWALVWGTIVMAATGFVLWFPAMAVKILPSMAITASQTIHYYEAWLAMLAVVVWHFFFVFLHPDAYPMSWTWLTGKMSMEAVRKHHERWYDEEIADDRE